MLQLFGVGGFERVVVIGDQFEFFAIELDVVGMWLFQ